MHIVGGGGVVTTEVELATRTRMLDNAVASRRHATRDIGHKACSRHSLRRTLTTDGRIGYSGQEKAGSTLLGIQINEQECRTAQREMDWSRIAIGVDGSPWEQMQST